MNPKHNLMLTLQQIEQHETGKWVSVQLDRLEELVSENGSDEELLNLIEFLREENDWWGNPDIEELDRRGGLALSGTPGTPH